MNGTGLVSAGWSGTTCTGATLAVLCSVTVGSRGLYVGGLVGSRRRLVALAYAVGAVSGTSAGGLVGFNGGTITQSYADRRGERQDVGGLVGYNTAPLRNPTRPAR